MTRRKDGLWQQQMTIQVDGRKKQKCFYGKTKAEVLKKISAFREEQEKGRSFEAVADEWWEQHEKTLAYNTTKPYKPAVARAKEYFNKVYIKDIKPLDVNRFILYFVKRHQAADKTARTQLMIINLICRYAVANGYVDSNPARDIDIPKKLKKYSRDMPSDEDIKNVKSHIDTDFGMFAFWILYTGCRKGELLALTWDDVDFDNRSISITKSIYFQDGHANIKQPKTNSGTREVPLMDKLLEKVKPASGVIFNKDGKHMSESQFRKSWERYRKQSGVTCTPHQLRHAYATMLFENDVSESDAQELLGHAQISTTKDVYTHIREGRKEKLKERLLNVDIV